MSAVLDRPLPTSVPPRVTGRRILSPSWPVTALFVGFPIWWALGIAFLIVPLLAVPMTFSLLRRRNIVLPSGSGLWLLFTAWTLLGVLMLGKVAPGTQPGSFGERLLPFLSRSGTLIGASVLLIYIANLSPAQLPAMRFARMLGFLFVVTVVGGVAGMLFPHGGFTSLAEYVLPHHLVSKGSYLRELIHPNFAQVQGFLGYETPRPAAPFAYTNEWGANLSLLLPFFVLSWFAPGSQGGQRWRRWLAPPILAVCAVVVIYSLNRGLWIAIALSVAYIVMVMVLRGRIRIVQMALAAALVGGVAFVATPLHTVVSERLAHGHSDTRRAYLATAALQGATHSPFLGWGSTRKPYGNVSSIAAGATPNCPRCAPPPIGTHGLIYLISFSHGFVGAGLMVAFFIGAFFRTRRDRRPFGIAATIVVGLVLVEMFFYQLIPFGLPIATAVFAMAWRERAAGRPVPATGVPRSLPRTLTPDSQ
ncbi:MAG: O-antigen ligase family protein [Frankiaceae bacterium]